VEMGVLKEGSTFAKLDLASYLSQDIYHGALVPLLSATVGLAWLARSRPTSGGAEKLPANFRAFEWSYFSVWALCAAADWLQGPYTYALYEAYGFSPAEIAQLFVVGYGSSLVFGCFVGSFTDRYGRKRCCILYCLLYLFSCLTKHFKRYSMLLVGRVTGGIATSMLNSCFECWMVSEHLQRHKFPEHLLSYMFSMMYTVMYCVAIASGLAGQAVTDAFAFRSIVTAPALRGWSSWVCRAGVPRAAPSAARRPGPRARSLVGGVRALQSCANLKEANLGGTKVGVYGLRPLITLATCRPACRRVSLSPAWCSGSARSHPRRPPVARRTE